MPRMIFINLPVADIAKSTAFYETMGAIRDARFCDASTSMMTFSETIHVMLLDHARFATFTSKPIADARASCEVLLALSAEGRDDVDAVVERAGPAGGRVDPCPRQDHGFMYGRSYEDLDGHIWEVVWMDPAAIAPAV